MFYGNDFNSQKYGYYYFPFLKLFQSYDTAYARVLGVNEMNLPNYIVFFRQRKIYLHLRRAFSAIIFYSQKIIINTSKCNSISSVQILKIFIGMNIIKNFLQQEIKIIIDHGR